MFLNSGHLDLNLPGLLTAVHKDYFRVVNYRELLFNDCGDRVAQLLHVELAVPFSQCRNNDIRQEILIVNTHLLFPHDSSLCLVRLNQVGALAFLLMQLILTLSSSKDFNRNSFRYIKSCSTLNLIRKKTNSIPCPSYFAGKPPSLLNSLLQFYWISFSQSVFYYLPRLEHCYSKRGHVVILRWYF